VKPLLALAACLAAAPVVYVLSAVTATVWYERRYLPTIAGDE
jgi:hypothetical protein